MSAITPITIKPYKLLINLLTPKKKTYHSTHHPLIIIPSTKKKIETLIFPPCNPIHKFHQN
jgi:hypothetical protein